MVKRKDLYVGIFYMPHRNISDTTELEKFLNKVTSDGARDRGILLAGHFNCPNVNWENNCVEPKACDPQVQKAIAHINSNALLTHDQSTCQSNSLDLWD